MSPNQSTQNIQQVKSNVGPSISKQFDSNNLFKPLKIESDNPLAQPPSQQSFTGQSFLEQFMRGVVGSESSNFILDREQGLLCSKFIYNFFKFRKIQLELSEQNPAIVTKKLNNPSHYIPQT
jgi:hypothetical protein